MTTQARRLAGVIFTLTLLVAFWLSVWHGMDQSVLSRVPILDEAHYQHRAVEIRNQGWLPERPFTMSPLYSYLVALTNSGRLSDEHQVRVGSPPHGIRILQALLWFGVAVLLWRVGNRLFGRFWGWGPALLWLLYGPAAIMAGQVLMEIPLVFVSTLGLAVSGGFVGPVSGRRRAVLAGVLVGAALLLRGTAVILVIPVLWGLTAGQDGRQGFVWRSWLTAAVPVGVALTLVVLPFIVLNSVRAGQLAPPAMNGGVNLYIGNGPGADGFYRSFPGFDVEKDPSGAAYLSGRTGEKIYDALTADQVWAAEARQAMAATPLRTLRLWGRKVWLHLAGVEIPQISAFTAWQRHVTLLRGLVVPWALLAVAGLAGGVLGWRRRPGLRPWLVAALLLVAVQSLFFVVTRYRLILVPSLALASVALAQELWLRRGRQLVVALLVLALAVGVVWPWSLARQVARLKAGGLDNEAVRWEHLATAVAGVDAAVAAEYLDEAEALYLRSQRIAEAQAASWRGLAHVLWARGERARAIAVLTDGLPQVSDSRELRRDLIGMLMLQRLPAEALPHLAEALRSDPDDVDLLENMVIAQANLGQLEQAAATAEHLVAAQPGDSRSYLTLGKVLARAGNLRGAEKVFGEGLRQLPRNRALKRNLDHVRELLAAKQK